MPAVRDVIRPWAYSVTSKPFVRYPILRAARFGVLPDAIWKRLPVEQTFAVPMGSGTRFQYSSTSNDAIGRSLFWKGIANGWEAETIRIFCAHAVKADLIIDIGANTGVFTLLACATNPKAHVISFEPVARIYDRLKSNIELNGWQTRCEVRNEAVSNIEGITALHVPEGDIPTSASLHPQGFRGVNGVLVDVPTTTIDAFCSPENRVDLVKIDVEGFEDRVLEGMEQTLISSAPTIIIECNFDGPYAKVDKILKSYGYSIFHLQSEGPVAVERIAPNETDEYRNFLCIARDTKAQG